MKCGLVLIRGTWSRDRNHAAGEDLHCDCPGGVNRADMPHMHLPIDDPKNLDRRLWMSMGLNLRNLGPTWVQSLPKTGETRDKSTQNQPKRDNKLANRFLVRDQGVGGSNPLSPTNYFQQLAEAATASNPTHLVLHQVL